MALFFFRVLAVNVDISTSMNLVELSRFCCVLCQEKKKAQKRRGAPSLVASLRPMSYVGGNEDVNMMCLHTHKQHRRQVHLDLIVSVRQSGLFCFFW